MPKVQWTNLPLALRQHLFDRLAEREISAEDLYQLKLWRESEPEAPDGPWYKDFGSFKICGEGKFPKTFLAKRRRASHCSPTRKAKGGAASSRAVHAPFSPCHPEPRDPSDATERESRDPYPQNRRWREGATLFVPNRVAWKHGFSR